MRPVILIADLSAHPRSLSFETRGLNGFVVFNDEFNLSTLFTAEHMTSVEMFCLGVGSNENDFSKD
jgi:hypothetical protein